ncbi:putative late blight resistance protein homolog R1A-10 [Salvia miltiorrhiza]|uniref:putative late blight resistance protein homolog R1A-10 n=1 Tax=Salvia miltiorrhiza TaxID=226208 RepID=UPI0025AB98E0|nr:putative late blight resistance protein homolog R1A-10 [Salvia miltiorrhiza]
MAETALTFLLEELRDTLKWYNDLLSGSKNDFDQLTKDLNIMKAFLSDAGERRKEKLFKEIEQQIREVVYEVEDTVDKCLAAAKGKGAISRLNTKKFTLAKEVRSLRDEKVKPVLDLVKANYAAPSGAGAGAGAGAGTADQQQPRPKKDQCIRREKVVGFEDEEEKLIGYLMDEKEKLDVISIIGMPGLGKTTLAWKIFENEQICFQFPVRIWVYVSQRFNSRDVFLNILRKFTSNDMSGLSDEELAQSVRGCLSKEKFLLVMDDVWRPDDWEVIQNVLPSSNKLSKVMITSRLLTVGQRAKVSHFSTEPHRLRFFRDDESWKLLQLEVFGNEEDCFRELVGIGMKIAKQCHGVPLTVVVVGGILVDLFVKTHIPRLLKREWETVSENVSKFAQNNEEKRISDAVELSYKTLPDYLRECFLYMAVFPEEHVVPAWMLTRLWIAEGFVRPKETSLEKAAEQNLNDLVSRNLLMLDQKNLMGEIKTCRVHDMIREFCKEIAVEQNLFREIRKNKEGILEPSVSDVEKFHRLCFHSDLTTLFSKKLNGPRVRSFLCFYKEPVKLDARYISTIPDAFILLRVLESISIRFHQFPAKVTKLIHLRYVTLHIETLTLLPEPLSQLWNLQTLVVETKSRSITMKANIWKMYRMRHLKLKAAIVLDPKWDGAGGENLQTLSRLAPESCTAKVCEKACNLKELGIRGKLASLFKTMSMEKLSRLEKLKLMNDLLADSEPRLARLPQSNCFPPNLKRLTLSNTFLDWEHMSTLAEINSLEVLKLKENACSGTSWNAAASVFESLQVLIITNADIVVWVVSADSFPCLSCLVLKNCEKLEHIPVELGNYLEFLEIERLRKPAVDSAKRIMEVKRDEEEQRKPKVGVRFKLQIGPGCGQEPN